MELFIVMIGGSALVSMGITAWSTARLNRKWRRIRDEQAARHEVEQAYDNHVQRIVAHLRDLEDIARDLVSDDHPFRGGEAVAKLREKLAVIDRARDTAVEYKMVLDCGQETKGGR